MKKSLLAIAAGALMAVSAQAATVVVSDSFGLATTNWTHTLSLPQFDGSLGTLNSVTISYNGEISSLFRLESLDAAAATLTANAVGNISFAGPISDALSISGSASQGVGAFDGLIDFGGASGTIVGPVVGTDSGSLVLTSGLAAFIGGGNWTVDVAATGLSNASGAGNLISQINTQALANVTVTYDYTRVVQVPEPASLALVGLALAGVAAASRRRKA